MNSILLNSTNNEQVDAALCSLIGQLETLFPHRIHSYYIIGSYSDDSNVPTSDVDLLIVFKNSLVDEQERAQVEEVVLQCASTYALELDSEILEEHSLSVGIDPTFKMGSRLLYGEDIREQVSLIPLAAWTRDRMHSSYWRTVHLFNRPNVVTYPLDYPDSSAEFYGYNARKLRLPNGCEVNCTRDLIRLVGWSATAILAFKAGYYVARKSDCHRLYKEYFHDGWDKLLQDIYEECRGRWNYFIPIDIKERKVLRSICERTLGFENHFLLIYKEFLLSELRSMNEIAIQHALWVLKQIVYQDNEIREALYILKSDSRRTEISHAAQDALSLYP